MINSFYFTAFFLFLSIALPSSVQAQDHEDLDGVWVVDNRALNEDREYTVDLSSALIVETSSGYRSDSRTEVWLEGVHEDYIVISVSRNFLSGRSRQANCTFPAEFVVFEGEEFSVSAQFPEASSGYWRRSRLWFEVGQIEGDEVIVYFDEPEIL